MGISKTRYARDPERFGNALLQFQEKKIERELKDDAQFRITPKVGRLENFQAVQKYLTRTLRRLERGAISASDAVRRAQIAAEIVRTIEKAKLEVIEKRLANLEQKAGESNG